MAALRSSLLALRSGSADVIAFKAAGDTVTNARAHPATSSPFACVAVDELGRLSAGRAEDETLLQQLHARLQELDSAVCRRLLMECHFRDEWRQECSTRALSELPNLIQDSEALDRMRNYVSLLAPEEDDAGAVQPWQRELRRQQQALAGLLKVCPVDSPDAIRSVLLEFMAHSQARLQCQLALVHDELQQSHPIPVAPNGSTIAAPQGSLALPKVGPIPHGVLGLSPEEFVQRLRGQHHAICAIQARFRGRCRRAAYQWLQAGRLSAAVRLQNFARRFAALRILHEKRHALWVSRCTSLAQWHSARRLQRAWRWGSRKRRWRAAWLKSAGARATKDDSVWRKALQGTFSVHRKQDQTGFSQFAVYVESKGAQERQRSEDAAVVVVQAFYRASVHRLFSYERARATLALQAATRGWLARTRDRWWRQSLCRLHALRRSRSRWRAVHEIGRALLPQQTRAVLVHLHVAKEISRVQVQFFLEPCLPRRALPHFLLQLPVACFTTVA